MIRFKKLGEFKLNFTEMDALLLLSISGFKKDLFEKHDQEFVEKLLKDIMLHFNGTGDYEKFKKEYLQQFGKSKFRL